VCDGGGSSCGVALDRAWDLSVQVGVACAAHARLKLWRYGPGQIVMMRSSVMIYGRSLECNTAGFPMDPVITRTRRTVTNGPARPAVASRRVAVQRTLSVAVVTQCVSAARMRITCVVLMCDGSERVAGGRTPLGRVCSLRRESLARRRLRVCTSVGAVSRPPDPTEATAYDTSSPML